MSLRTMIPRSVHQSRIWSPLLRSGQPLNARRHASFNLGPTASPPRLPDKEQKIFEELQRRSTGAFMQQPSAPSSSSSSSSNAFESSQSTTSSAAAASQSEPEDGQTIETTPIARIQADGQGGELHPHMRRGAPPEFEGDVNPKTGEVGGPKNEPLRWGGMGEWSYNGRTTDF